MVYDFPANQSSLWWYSIYSIMISYPAYLPGTSSQQQAKLKAMQEEISKLSEQPGSMYTSCLRYLFLWCIQWYNNIYHLISEMLTVSVCGRSVGEFACARKAAVKASHWSGKPFDNHTPYLSSMFLKNCYTFCYCFVYICILYSSLREDARSVCPPAVVASVGAHSVLSYRRQVLP